MFIVSWDSFQCRVGIVLFTTKFGTFSFSLFLILWCGGEKFICFHVAVDAGQIVRERALMKSPTCSALSLLFARHCLTLFSSCCYDFHRHFSALTLVPGWKTITLYTNSDTNLFITHRAIINCFEISETTPNRPDGVYQKATEREFIFYFFLFSMIKICLPWAAQSSRAMMVKLQTIFQPSHSRRIHSTASTAAVRSFSSKHTRFKSFSEFPFSFFTGRKNERDCVTSRHFHGLTSTYMSVNSEK